MRRLLLALGLVAFLARPAVAQIPLFVAGQAGAAFDVGSNSPNSGGGFAYQAAIGLRLRRLSFGGEFGRHTLGGGRTARLLGAFVRLATLTTGQVRPYLVVGLADYRYTPTSAGKTHSIGGSIGPGLLVPMGGRHAGLLFEVRYHSGFQRVSNFSHREFVSVGAGLELGI